MLFSVIIPAHNEETYIGRCIHSIKKAEKAVEGSVEIIVVCNRCTDGTARIAQQLGARVVEDETRCIAQVRNAGIRAATGKIIVTIDADNRMTPGTLLEIKQLLSSGKYIGGGGPVRFERLSFPLFLNELHIRISTTLTGCYVGIFWAKKETFDAIGGFADYRVLEDYMTAKALKKYGKRKGLRYTTLKKNALIVSTRKFDEQGDWVYLKMFQHPGSLLKAALGDRRGWNKMLDAFYYDYNDNKMSK